MTKAEIEHVNRLDAEKRSLQNILHATELERDDFHRELMDLRYQLELAKA